MWKMAENKIYQHISFPLASLLFLYIYAAISFGKSTFFAPMIGPAHPLKEPVYLQHYTGDSSDGKKKPSFKWPIKGLNKFSN